MKKFKWYMWAGVVLLVMALIGFPLDQLLTVVLCCCAFGVALSVMLGSGKLMDKLITWGIGLSVLILVYAVVSHAVWTAISETNWERVHLPPLPEGSIALMVAFFAPLLVTVGVLFSLACGLGLLVLVARVQAALPAPPIRPRPTFRIRGQIVNPTNLPAAPWQPLQGELLPPHDVEDDLNLFGGGPDDWR